MLDAVALVGLMADPARRRVIAALVLDEDDVASIAGRSGLSIAAVGTAVSRLEMLSQEFDVGRRYSEKMVNLILVKWHADTAAWRRYLVDEGYLDRAAGEYWRSGGSVPS